MKNLTSTFGLVCLTILFSSCGGGGGGSSGTSSALVNGVASAGLLNGSTVCAYAITNSLKGTLIGNCQPTSSGKYSINLGTYTGPVLFETTGGNYVDEATGSTIPLSSPLHGFLPNATSGNNSVAITPLTEVAYLNANAMSGGLTNANIQSAITGVENSFGVTNIVNTLPVDALNVPVGATAAQKLYSLGLADVSQYVQDQQTSLSIALQTLGSCIASGSPTICGTGNTSVGTQLNTSQNTYTANHPAYSGMALPLAYLGNAYDGTYTGTILGERAEKGTPFTFTFTVVNGAFTVIDPPDAGDTGSVSQSGAISASAITLPNGNNCPGTDTLTGQISINSSGVATATGSAYSSGTLGICAPDSTTWTASRTSMPITAVAQFNGNYNASTVESGTGIVQPFSFTATNGVIAGSTFGGTISGAISSTGAISMSFSGGVCNTNVSVTFTGQTAITPLGSVTMTGTWSDPGDPSGPSCAPASGTWTTSGTLTPITGVTAFDGQYTGSASGTLVSGGADNFIIQFTVANGAVTTVDNTTGTVTTSGAINFTAGGCASGNNGVPVPYDTAIGQITISTTGVATASGTWSAPSWAGPSGTCDARSGTWAATR